VRSKEHYQLEVRSGTSPGILKNIFEASFCPLPRKPGAESSFSEWSVDMRVPLSEGLLLRPLAAEIAAVLAHHAVSQVAGAGFGAIFLVGGIVAAATGFKGGFIRESRKDNGFRKLVEGGLDRQRPTFIVDDVLSSGKSAISTAAVLRQEGFLPAGVLTVLRYGWKQGDDRVREAGLISESLATLYPLYG
jgi:orotate phosphoribosyltransferase